MTMTMNTLSASARSAPHAPLSGPSRSTRTTATIPRTSAAPFDADGDPCAPSAVRVHGDRGAAERTGGRGWSRAASVVQLLELVEIHVAELESQPLGEHLSTTTPSRTSRETPSSIRNGKPAVHRKAVRAMPLSTISSPTIWNVGRRRATSTKKPIEHGGDADRGQRSGSGPDEVGHAAAGDERQHDERGRGDQRGGDVHERPALARCGVRAAGAPEEDRDDHPLDHHDDGRRGQQAGIVQVHAEHHGDQAQAAPWTATTEMTARIEASHRIATAQTSTAPEARVRAEAYDDPLTAPPAWRGRPAWPGRRPRPATRAPGRGGAWPPSPRTRPGPSRARPPSRRCWRGPPRGARGR